MIALSLLLALVVYVLLGLSAVKLVGKFKASKGAKYLVIALFVLIPTWDIIPGQFYFEYLCRNEAGIKVLKTVEVDKDYFLANGEPDQKKLSKQFDGPMKFDDNFSKAFHIRKSEGFILDIQTNEVLGIATNLSYFGGWVNAYLFPQGPPETCPGYSVYRDLWRAAIKPAQDRTGGN